MPDKEQFAKWFTEKHAQQVQEENNLRQILELYAKHFAELTRMFTDQLAAIGNVEGLKSALNSAAISTTTSFGKAIEVNCPFLGISLPPNNLIVLPVVAMVNKSIVMHAEFRSRRPLRVGIDGQLHLLAGTWTIIPRAGEVREVGESTVQAILAQSLIGEMPE